MKVTFGIIFSAVLIGAVFSSPRSHDDNYPSHQGSYHGSNYNDGYRGPHRGGGYGSSYGSHHQGGNKYQGSSYQHGRPYGYGYKKVLCPKLDAPENGKVNVSGLYPGDGATYSCDDGYVLVGLSKRKCLRDGKWSQKAPICKRINCGPLPHIANGAVDVSPDTRLNSVATYSCDAGYNLQGGSTRTCQANGEWSGSEPSCSSVDCGDLDDPDKGWVHISPDTLLGSVAIYRCKLGYELSSGDRRYCQTDGTWSNDAPTCEPISCGPVPEPKDNGRIDNSDGTSLRDQTTYACNDGYILEGTATIYCQNDKTYSDDSPKCIPVDCGEPDPTDPNGSLDVSTTTLGSVASYSCNSGFILEGSAQATCQANGEWSSDAPTCTPVDCGSLSAPENGAVYFYPGTTFTSTASFVCRRGFRLVGSETRTCQADGSWSGVQPVCKKIKCPKLKAPQYGKLYVSGNHPGDYAVYDCGYGYKLVGKRRRTCGYNGKWSGSDADCVKDSHYGGGYGPHYGGHDY